jgi:hypothetical protein
MMMITVTLAVSANGSSHTISAISQPANTPVRKTVWTGGSMACRPGVSIAARVSGEKIEVCALTEANRKAPATLAARTVAQSRAILANISESRRRSTGRTTVSVFSVNNCWRPRMTSFAVPAASEREERDRQKTRAS